MTEKLRQQLDPLHSFSEEMASVVTHGIGAGMSIAGLVLLILTAQEIGDVYSLIGVSVYGASLVLLYLASTLFHAMQRPEVKASIRHAFHVADHIGIFLLIAGTYTPILLGPLRGRMGWSFLIFVWTMALIGSIIKLFFTGRYNKVTTVAYIAMGWSAVFMLGDLGREMGTAGLVWILVGGAVYTIGVIPYLWNKLPFNHAIWHLFVMGGSICHFVGIFYHAI